MQDPSIVNTLGVALFIMSAIAASSWGVTLGCALSSLHAKSKIDDLEESVKHKNDYISEMEKAYSARMSSLGIGGSIHAVLPSVLDVHGDVEEHHNRHARFTEMVKGWAEVELADGKSWMYIGNPKRGGGVGVVVRRGVSDEMSIWTEASFQRPLTDDVMNAIAAAAWSE